MSKMDGPQPELSISARDKMSRPHLSRLFGHPTVRFLRTLQMMSLIEIFGRITYNTGCMRIAKAKIKVAVGVSGGVDSSVAAALLKQQGYDVFGVFMHFWSEDVCGKVRDNICCSLEAQEDARKVCRKLGIPFYVMNFKTPFKNKIVDAFIESYRKGETPNPCVICNKFIKFGEFLKKAKALGADMVATGHYARLTTTKFQNPSSLNQMLRIDSGQAKQDPTPKFQKSKTTIYRLMKSVDTKKDQTYFLHQLNQEQLARILFPVGKMKKDEVRELAKKFGLITASKKESQEVCFIPSGNLEKFLEKYIPPVSGSIVEIASKKVLGRHRGLSHYTIGQRKGIGLGGGPWFVVKLDKKKNVLWVSRNSADFSTKEIVVNKVHWIAGFPPEFPLTVKCRIRYGSDYQTAEISEKSNGSVLVQFKKPVRAATPGQFCVFWKGQECLGGGEIKK